ncbi:42985_t:CDS:2, partial [Gigaspora margarita]
LNGDLEISEHNEYKFTNSNSELRSSVDRLVIGYDTSANDIEMLNDQEDSYSKDGTNRILHEPCTIIYSRFCNSKLIDKVMLHLYLKNKFDVPNKKMQNNINIINYNSIEQFRPAYEDDDNLIKL